MSKGILNNRDKMIWDNTHKPEITDVVSVVDDEMDDLLEDHDDKVVDIVGDNMNDLLDAHDDKVVSIVGDNMSTLLSSNAAAIRLIAGDKSGITSTPAKVGTWDATHDIYAFRYTNSNLSVETTYTDINILTVANAGIVTSIGYVFGQNRYFNVSGYASNSNNCNAVLSSATDIIYRVGNAFAGGKADFIVYYLVSTETPTP